MKNFLDKKNVLVTGATGLVGGHVSEALLAKGARLFTLSRKPGKTSYFVKNNFHKQATNISCDILNFSKLAKIIKQNKIEYIFHLAAQLKLVSLYETFGFNIMGANNILEAARQAGTVKGIILASSNRAYYVESGVSQPDMHKLWENPYDVSKIASDLIAKNYAKAYGLPVVICRFGNVFGPGDLQKRIIPVLIKRSLDNQVLEISVRPAKRNYIYAADIARGLLLAAQNLQSLGGLDINFETPDYYNVEELIKKIHLIFGKKVNYKISPGAYEEIALKRPKNNLADNLFGWKPKYTFKKALQLTFDWYK